MQFGWFCQKKIQKSSFIFLQQIPQRLHAAAARVIDERRRRLSADQNKFWLPETEQFRHLQEFRTLRPMNDFGGFEIEFVNRGGAVDAIGFLVLHVADDEIQKARLRKPFQRNLQNIF